MFLLDTNFIIHLTKKEAACIAFLRHHAFTNVFTCSVVSAELYYGAFKSKRTHEVLEHLKKINIFQSLDFGHECAFYYGQLRAELQRKGKLIGANDMLIAAIALKHNKTLVTRNLKEYSLVPDLKVIGY